MMENKTRRWILVLGMHRSGTSAIAGALAHNGIAFGDSFIELQGDVNEKGFWEHAELVAINEALLKELGAAWFDPFSLMTQFEQGWRPSDALFGRMCAFLRHPEFADAQQCGLKDPRLSVLLPCWQQAMSYMGDEACYLLMNRDMDQVARSLQKRDQMSLLLGQLLWGEYTFSAEAYTRNLPRCWLDYEVMLANPGAALAHIQLQLSLSTTASADFIDPSMQRQLSRGSKNSRVTSLNVLADKIAAHGEQILEHDWSHWHAHYRDELASAELWLQTLVTDFRTLNTALVASLHLGESHSLALATIDQRDEQLALLHQQLGVLGEQHAIALDTLRVRDAEIHRLNEQLQEEGEAHGYAIRIVEQRDVALNQCNLEIDAYKQRIEDMSQVLEEQQLHLNAIRAHPMLHWFINRFVTKL
ncbi:TPA: sulfotransferase family protein [Aeromonas veronii]|uniref:sulfotransferase family protein n=1 Tax=Aeromonas veronii TaxID=654 RepID=UPI003BA37656